MSNRSKTAIEALQQPCTQAEFGKMVGISQQAVSGLVGKGVLLSGQTAQQWLHRYLTHLREVIIDRRYSQGSQAQ